MRPFMDIKPILTGVGIIAVIYAIIWAATRSLP